jgi:hypothetical protein
MTVSGLRTLGVAAAALLLAGCGGSSSPTSSTTTASGGPSGSVSGELDKDCTFGGCQSEDAKDAASASYVWCRWKDGHVIVHLNLENGMNAHVTAQIVPRYEIVDGGTHGDSFASEKEVEVAAYGYTPVSLDAGAPEGVPVNAPISVCSPRLLDIDVTNP